MPRVRSRDLPFGHGLFVAQPGALTCDYQSVGEREVPDVGVRADPRLGSGLVGKAPTRFTHQIQRDHSPVGRGSPPLREQIHPLLVHLRHAQRPVELYHLLSQTDKMIQFGTTQVAVDTHLMLT